MPARTALLIAIGDVVETGPPTTRRASSASASSSTAKLKNGFRAGHSAGGSQHTPNRLRCHSETASEIQNSDDNLSTVSSLSDPDDDEVESGVQDGLSRALKMKTRGIGPKSRTRLLSVESESTSNNGLGLHPGDEMDQGGPLSPRTRSTTKQEKKLRVNAPEFDEEVSFSEAPSGLSEEDFGDSNPPGETNGHTLDDPEESDGNNASQETRLIPHNSSEGAKKRRKSSAENSEGAKKRRKSSAEKFLEDNSEYYGIQVLPNKLRSKITFHKSFLEFLKSGSRQSGNNGQGQHARHNFLCRQQRPTTSSLDRVVCGSELGVETNDHLGSASSSSTSFSSLPSAGEKGHALQGSWELANRGVEDKKTKQRHKSASQETSPRVELHNGKHRRRRLVSSPGSNGVDPTHSDSLKSTSIIGTSTTSSVSSPTTTTTTISTTTTHISKRLLRVDVERLQVDNANHSKESDGESDGEPVDAVGQNEEEQQQQQQPGEVSQEDRRPRYRKSKRQAAALAAQQMSERDRNQDSPSPKRRRTELDKLLEAGSSSFHFETARQASCRENGLGPIHVDVTDHHSNSSTDESQNKPAKASTTLKISVKKTKTRVVEVHAETDEDNEDNEDDVEVEEEPVKEEEENEEEKEEEKEEELEEQTSRLQSKGGKKKRGHRRLLLTKEDLLDGPLHIAPKEDRKKKSGPLRRFSREPNVNDYLPRDLFESLDERLGRITSESVDVNGMSFSFEHTPFNEGWFQTYSRQDQGDEILFYPETHWFPLPYEMPISTFYTKKEGGTSGGGPLSGKAKRKILEESASGSITPDESPRKTTRKGSIVTAEPPPKSLRRSAMESRKKEARSSVSSSEGKKSGILARLGPKGAIPDGLGGNLNDAHRKSPRCHASTKALLTCASVPEGEEEPVDVGNPVPPSEDENPLIDECSNDSTFSHVSSATNQNRKFKSESSQEYKDLSLNIELFLKQDDASLAGQESDGDRPSSLTFKKKKRRSSGKHTNSASAQHSGEDPMDRIVAANVDPLLLDCLEDELPSVTIDEEIPGSEPLELLDNYETCDSMAQVCNSRWMRAMSIIPDPSPRKVFKTKRINSPPPVTVHRPELDDSSSEYATSVNEETGSVHSLESTTSSGRRKVKRKRNLTGFPNPKKRRKTPSLLNNVLTKRTIAASTSTKNEPPSGKAAKQSAPVPKGKAPMGTAKGLAQISDDESDVDADESGSDEEEDEDDKTQEVEGRSLRNVTRAEPKCYRDPDSDLDLGDDLKVPVRRKLKVPKTPSPKKVGKVTKKLKTPLKVPKKSSRHTRSKRK
ncbi:claspin-like [Tigriopus californicus]|uniref:claspin-like n=1 Tax=Tigriopus californicus TaxID=6832 RepID=UPI0027DA88EA|nr:claspin-like [Tigriopus californicus]